MAAGDPIRKIQISSLDVHKVNEALRQISGWITKLEGRSGPINLRDSLSVQSSRDALIDFSSTISGKAAIVAFGTEKATLAFAKGATHENTLADGSGDWIATDTVSVIWALSRDGTATLYADTGLTIGAAFTPTVSATFPGSTSPHALVGSSHTVSGLNTGDVLTATSATTFGFQSSIDMGDGSVSAPAYSFTADTNTGIYRTGADSLGLSVGGGTGGFPTWGINTTALSPGATNTYDIGAASKTIKDLYLGGNLIGGLIKSNMPFAIATHSVDQSISAATWTKVALDTDLYDAWGYHNTSTNSDRMTVPSGYGGLHLVIWFGVLDTIAATKLMSIGIRLNSDTAGVGHPYQINQYTPNTTATYWFRNLVWAYPLAEGDYVGADVYQGDTGAVNFLGGASSPRYPLFIIVRLGSNP